MKVDVSPYWDDIQKGSKWVSMHYGGRFSADDVAQGIVLDILQNPSRYNQIAGNFRFLIIKRAGLRYCAQQSAMFLTYGDQYIYSSEELKGYLETYYLELVVARKDPGTQPVLSADETYEQFRNRVEIWSERSNLFIEGADITHGLALLTGSQRRIIEKKYRDKEPVLSKYEQNLHSIAMMYLTSHVNERASKAHDVDHFHEGPGARRAMSNQASITTTRNDDDEESGNPDALTQVKRVNNLLHPATVPSRHVVDSPWR
jgi:hypothetical protein